MAVQELDPTFVRALKLLQSRSKESTEQLRQILHELTEQRKAELASKRVLSKLYIVRLLRQRLHAVNFCATLCVNCTYWTSGKYNPKSLNLIIIISKNYYQKQHRLR